MPQLSPPAFEPSWVSLLPAGVTILLAFATRQVILALFAGIVAGSLVLYGHSGNPTDLNFVSKFLIPALGDPKYAQILLIYLWSLGGLLGIWKQSGAALHFAEQVGLRFSKGRNSALFFAWLLGIVFHQGGTISTVLTGSTVKPVTDRHRVSHEELSYVVDSTASPVATILPFNAWPVYVGGLVAGTIPLIPDQEAAIGFFMSSIAFNFYALFAVFSTLLFALRKLPWVFGPMLTARERVLAGGPLDRPGATPMLLEAHSPGADVGESRDKVSVRVYQPSLIEFVVPLGLLIGLNVIPYLLWGQNWVNEAFLGAVISAMVIVKLRGMSLGRVFDGFIGGCSSMTVGAVVLGLAVTLGLVAKELNTAAFVVGLLEGGFSPVMLPAALMLFAMVIAFATGTSWGTYAVVFPLAMPLAFAVNPDPMFVHVCFGAVLGGAVFGDQCSPISDTTILSSMFTGCDLMDHVKTQLPLAFSVAMLAAFCSTIAAALING